jgi:hypothetical protein
MGDCGIIPQAANVWRAASLAAVRLMGDCGIIPQAANVWRAASLAAVRLMGDCGIIPQAAMHDIWATCWMVVTQAQGTTLCGTW